MARKYKSRAMILAEMKKLDQKQKDLLAQLDQAKEEPELLDLDNVYVSPAWTGNKKITRLSVLLRRENEKAKHLASFTISPNQFPDEDIAALAANKTANAAQVVFDLLQDDIIDQAIDLASNGQFAGLAVEEVTRRG